MNKINEIKKISDPIDFAKYAKLFRLSKSIKLKKAAEDTGRSESQVIRIEQTGCGPMDTIIAYCNAIGLALYIGPADTEPAPGTEDIAPSQAPQTTAADLQQFADMYALVRPSVTQVASFCKYKGWTTDPAAGILADSPAGFVYLDSDNNPKIRMR